jgi:hypothetical protein
MIAGRLLLHRHRMRAAIGISQSSMRRGGQYLTIASVLIESAFVYAGICTIFVILLQKKSPAVGWWNGLITAASVREFLLRTPEVLSIECCVQYLCQSWIILRIVLGTAISSTSVVTVKSTIQPIPSTGVSHSTGQGTDIGTEGEDPVWHRDKLSHLADSRLETNMELVRTVCSG